VERANLEIVFDKSGLGYKPEKKKNVKKLSSFFAPTKTKYVSFNSSKNMHSISCFYCMKSDHTDRSLMTFYGKCITLSEIIICP